MGHINNGTSKNIRDRSKITSHNLITKTLKILDILQTECELIFEPALRRQSRRVILKNLLLGLKN